MRFLIDADLPRRSVELLVRYGHDAVDVRDVGMRSADDRDIAIYARQNQFCLITCDFGFADIRNYPPRDYAGLVVLEPPHNATGDLKLSLLESLLRQNHIVDQLVGALAIVAPKGIRIRRG